MAYRVGFQCFDTADAATDYKMSQVIPHITQDGRLVYPMKIGNVWTFNGQIISLSHGYCDPAKDFADGAMIAGAFIGLFVLVFCFRTAKAALNMIDRSDNDNDKEE